MSNEKVLIICSRIFNDHEFWLTLSTLLKNSIGFEIVSTHLRIAGESNRQPIQIKKTLQDIEINSFKEIYKGLIHISGDPKYTEAYWFDNRSREIVKEAARANLPIAAICCAVPSIRDAARNRRVSYYSLQRAKDLLTQSGAILSQTSVTIDMNIITASDEMCTQVWAEQFCLLVKKQKTTLKLQEVHLTKRGSERMLHPRLERLRGIPYHPKHPKENLRSDHS